MVFRRRIQDQARGPTTYVGNGSKICGRLTGKGAYVFCGEVEGDCEIEGPVTLAQGVHWKGTLRATDVIIAGSVEGDVIAEQRVEIGGTARIQGSISGQAIAVAEGAIIEGEIKVLSGKPPVKFEEKRDWPADQRAAG
jgi:cytoskeletal protein CcmA (bactofilin family)